MANEKRHRKIYLLERLRLSNFAAVINKRGMDEQTLQLAQKLAREATLEEDESRDGHPNPLPLRAKLEDKVKGFR